MFNWICVCSTGFVCHSLRGIDPFKPVLRGSLNRTGPTCAVPVDRGQIKGQEATNNPIKRVRTRVVVVVVVVRELLFLVTSVICVRIRGRGSEVTTTPYHIQEG